MENVNKKGCKFLRAKNAYGTMEGGDAPFLPLDEGTTTYWCLRTCSPMGPDNFIAYTDACTSNRVCFQSIEEVSDTPTSTITSDNLLT